MSVVDRLVLDGLFQREGTLETDALATQRAHIDASSGLFVPT